MPANLPSRLAALVALSGLLAVGPASAEPDPAATELLVLGTPHLGNPGRDTANASVPDVGTAQRQREIQALVTRLARWRPDHVAVEWPSDQQPELDRQYADYRTGRLAARVDEQAQVAFRLASALGLARVDAVDAPKQPVPAGLDIDYDAWARTHGQAGIAAAAHADWKAAMDAYQARLPCLDVGQWYALANTDAFRQQLGKPYLEIARIGDGTHAPGAAWVANWQLRNLRIFANLSRLGPGQPRRILALFGFGHVQLLERDARDSGRFTVVPARTLLPQVSSTHCTSSP